MRLWTPCKDDVFFSKISSSLIECFLTENEQLFAANSDGWVEAADEVFSIKFSLPRQNLSHLADWSVVTSEPSPCSLRVSYDFIIILSIKLFRQFFDRQTNNVSSRMSHISLSLRKIAWGNLEFMTRYTGKRPTNANSVQLTLKKMLYFTLPLAREREHSQILKLMVMVYVIIICVVRSEVTPHLPFLAPSKRDPARWIRTKNVRGRDCKVINFDYESNSSLSRVICSRCTHVELTVIRRIFNFQFQTHNTHNVCDTIMSFWITSFVLIVRERFKAWQCIM